MNILLVIADSAPIGGSHSIRMSRMIDSLLNANYCISVLTADSAELHPQFDPVNYKMPDCVKVYHTPMGFIHKKIYNANYSRSKVDNKKTTIGEKNYRSSLKKIIIKAYRYFVIPDTLIDWYFAFLKCLPKLKKQLEEEFDLIISCSMPNTAHLIGYKLSKCLKVPLALDIADPWAYINGYKERPIRHFLQRRMEKKIIKHTAFISFSTYGAQKLYEQCYRIPKEKMITILTGYSAEQRRHAIEFAKKGMISDRRLRIIYGGAILPGVRNPEPLFDAILKLMDSQPKDAIFLQLFVDNIDYIKEKINDTYAECIQVSEYIPYNELMQQMLTSDVLILFGNSTVNQLPGKVFEYIATGKHILYLLNCNKNEDQVLPILEKYQNYTCVYNSADDIQHALLILIEKKKNNLLPQKFNENTDFFLDTKQFEQMSSFIKAWNNDQF